MDIVPKINSTSTTTTSSTTRGVQQATPPRVASFCSAQKDKPYRIEG